MEVTTNKKTTGMTGSDIQALNERIAEQSAFVDKIEAEIGKVIVGQHDMRERLLIGLLAQGHILLEGVPGLAKTLAIKTLAATIKRIWQAILAMRRQRLIVSRDGLYPLRS